MTTDTAESKINAALNIARQYASTDGAHHKQWVIDQMCRALTGEGYDAFVAQAKNGEEGPNTYQWHTGIAP